MTSPLTQDWPIVERKLPTEYDAASGLFIFEDGDGLEVDCVIYCTGYRHTFLDNDVH